MRCILSAIIVLAFGSGQALSGDADGDIVLSEADRLALLQGTGESGVDVAMQQVLLAAANGTSPEPRYSSCPATGPSAEPSPSGESLGLRWQPSVTALTALKALGLDVTAVGDAEGTSPSQAAAAAKADKAFDKHAHDLEDGEGGKAQLVLWNKAGEDLWGAIARSERIVNAMEALLDDEVYHYHSKMSIKRPRTGGAWSWHQDYGYWYQNGCLYPDMASAFIAIAPNTRANGCMQVLKGSHKLGRVEHGRRRRDAKAHHAGARAHRRWRTRRRRRSPRR